MQAIFAKETNPVIAAHIGGNLALLSMLGALLMLHPDKEALRAVWSVAKEDMLSKLLHSGMQDDSIQGFEDMAEILEGKLGGGFVSVDSRCPRP